MFIFLYIYRYIACSNFFNGNNSIPLKLVEEDMNVTVEIDDSYILYLNNKNNEEIIIL